MEVVNPAPWNRVENAILVPYPLAGSVVVFTNECQVRGNQVARADHAIAQCLDAVRQILAAFATVIRALASLIALNIQIPSVIVAEIMKRLFHGRELAICQVFVPFHVVRVLWFVFRFPDLHMVEARARNAGWEVRATLAALLAFGWHAAAARFPPIIKI